MTLRRIGREPPRAGIRWVVDETSPRTLGEVLIWVGEPPQEALVDGRVFVENKRAVDLMQPLALGDLVEIYSPRVLPEQRLKVLGEIHGLWVFEKPPEIPTEPDKNGTLLSMRALAARELGMRETELHAVNRLDVGVSGLVMFAVGSAARKHLVDVRKKGLIRRRYLAISAKPPAEERGRWTSAVDRRQAETRFTLVRRAEPNGTSTLDGVTIEAALLALDPLTGRTHQLRAHAQRAKIPLLGDRAHGGESRIVMPDGRVRQLDRIALHAARVRIHEYDGRYADFTSPIPNELVQLWRDLGGNAVAFDLGLNQSF